MASPAPAPAPGARSRPLEINIKNPALGHLSERHESFALVADEADTVGDLKKSLATSYPGQPAPETVTVSPRAAPARRLDLRAYRARVPDADTARARS
jgi:hypothetical protein